MPARQIAKSKTTDSNTNQMFDAVANGFEHAANLPIDSLSKNNAQFRGRDRAELRDLRSLSVEKNSAQQSRHEHRIPRPIQRHFVFFLDFVTRMCEPLRQFTVVCEKKQALGLRVQATDIEQLGKFLWKQIKDSVARMRIFSGGNKPRGFTQHDGERWGDANQFAIDFNVIVRVGLCTEVRAYFTIDGDATRRDQFIAIPARSDAGGGEITVEAHLKRVRCKK